MSEKKMSQEELSALISKIEELGLSYREGAKRFGISVWKIYNFKKTKTKSEGSLKSSSEVKPEVETLRSSKSKLPNDVEELIASYKEQNPDHGFKRIEECLKQNHMLVVSRKQIRKVLKERGLLAEGDSSFDRPMESEKGTRRFEASHPRALYQMDVTYVYLEGMPVHYLANIMDDYSRFCVGAELRLDQRADSLCSVLHTAILRYGKPKAVLTDQGPSFYSWSMHHTRFQQYLDDMGIEHIVADPHSPQTLGKVERFHQTLKNELLTKRRFSSYEEAVKGIVSYIAYYNYERPHQGIEGVRPADRFHGVCGERRRVEAELLSQKIDFSRGYVICKFQDHTISIAVSSDVLRVFLDGELMVPERKSEPK